MKDIYEKWEKLSLTTRLLMGEMGDFGPTADGQTIKGYPQESGKTYYDSKDLKAMASALIEVANLLDDKS